MDGPPRQPAATQAYEAIRNRIMSGEFPGGMRLTEQGLAEDLGLSRTPVRGAMTRLLHEGFIEKGDGYSTRVAAFPEEELDQLFEVRRRLECYAAERAARLATPEEIDELDRLAAEMIALTPPRDPDDYAALSTANASFHRVLAEAARSPRLRAVLAVAVDVGVVARTYRAYQPADLIRSARHHQELVEAIRARSPEWASSVMSSHVLAAAVSAAKPNRRKG